MDIIIPWRDTGCKYRKASLRYLLKYMSDYNVILADDGAVSFSRAGAKNWGVSQTTQDVLFFLDADMVVPHSQIEAAADMAREHGVSLAYDKYIYLPKASTKLVYVGHDPFVVESSYTVDWPVGGAVVFHRDIYPQYDEGFIGWGMEDVAIIETLHQKGIELQRINGLAAHLWHPGHMRGPNEIANEERYSKLYLGE